MHQWYSVETMSTFQEYELWLRNKRFIYAPFAQFGLRHGVATPGSLVRIQQDAPHVKTTQVRFSYSLLFMAYGTIERFIISHFFIWDISSVGQSIRLITGRSGVRVPDVPPKIAVISIQRSDK